MGRRVETIGLVIMFCLGVALIKPSEQRSFSKGNAEAGRFVEPPQHIELMTFGYNENVSDSLWLRVIQDMDYCDASRSLVAAPAETIDSKVAKAVRPPACHSNLGWVYRMLDAVTSLTPKFRMPYNHGATILSVEVGDKEGARRIFERGIENFPGDWSLQFRAAYHSIFEVNDPRRAAELLTMAGKNGAPPWVFALAARLYTEDGQALLARSVLQSVLEDDPDSKYAQHLKDRLKQLDEIIAAKKLSR